MRLDSSQTVNADGCGIAWYNHVDGGPEACVLVSNLPAWNSASLLRLVPKIRSTSIFAHIRASTTLRSTEAECHPFEFGNLVWMHNGSIGNWDELRRPLSVFLPAKWHRIIQGQSDSEWAFALFLSLLDNEGFDPSAHPEQGYPIDILRSTLVRTIYTISGLKITNQPDYGGGPAEVSLLNFAVSDGRSCVVSRYADMNEFLAPSLYYCHGSRWTGHVVKGDYSMCEPVQSIAGTQRTMRESSAVLIASEPITQDSGES